MRFLQDKRTTDIEIEQVEEGLKALVETKTTKHVFKRRGIFKTQKKLKKSQSINYDEKTKIKNANSFGVFSDDQDLHNMRCKSCVCKSCGGLSYYNRIEKKILLLPTFQENKPTSSNSYFS